MSYTVVTKGVAGLAWVMSCVVPYFYFLRQVKLLRRVTLLSMRHPILCISIYVYLQALLPIEMTIWPTSFICVVYLLCKHIFETHAICYLWETYNPMFQSYCFSLHNLLLKVFTINFLCFLTGPSNSKTTIAMSHSTYLCSLYKGSRDAFSFMWSIFRHFRP